MKTPRFVRCLALLVALILAGVACTAALAEQPEPTGVPYKNTDESGNPLDRDHSIFIGLYWNNEDSERKDALIKVKNTLYEYGYYGQTNRDSISFFSNKLDESTLLAVMKCCNENEGMSDLFRMEGLTYGAWDRISRGDILNLNAPAETVEPPEKYVDIPFGGTDENLPAIVNALYALKYLDNRDHDTYDDAVREAIRLFGQQNGLPDYYDNDPEGEVRPIEVRLQRMLLEEQTLVARPAEKKGLKEYFLGKVQIGSMKVPMLALWCLGLAVLVGGALAALYFFSPAEARKSRKSSKNALHFSITYKGVTQETETQIEKTLKIGRGIGNFPLNMEDTMISRRHCELYYNNNALMLRDYSANGTTVNGKSVSNAECLVHSGDTIVIGNHTIVITF